MASPRQLSSPRDVILHIGTGKAGSTSIQNFLRENRARLLESGLLYPETPGNVRHFRLGLYVKTPAELAASPEWSRQHQSDPVRFRRILRRRLLSEVERSGVSRVLFSDEVLFGVSDPAVRRLRRLTNRVAESTRLVVYLRRQDDHMVSRYQQGVKIGWVRRLREWAQEDMSGLYNYHARLHTHAQLLAPSEFVVRRFEPDSFVGRSLFQDFLEAAGIDTRAEDMAQVPNRNLSLDAESVEFLRLLNLYRVQHEAATPGLIDNRALNSRLAGASSGPTLTMPAPFLDEFMSRWEWSNQRVARDFVGDASGQLFHLPRKTRNTTTEQFLDPLRLDHFLSLLELPEQLHAPLRALAEREARAR